MNVLIVGNGGREHALAWKAAQSPLISHVYVTPGNAGTQNQKNTTNVDIQAIDIGSLTQFAKENQIDLTIVGPEAPLSSGIVDSFQNADLLCFGPTKKAAQLESSKAFCKAFLKKHKIPTAQYGEFRDVQKAINYLDTQSFPIVIKADGLAAGKGVIIANTKEEAQNTVRDMLTADKFGEAGRTIIIEEFLQGEELSYIVLSDGKHILPLASSQDHKRRDDGDKGPNTGGMGAYSPAPRLTSDLEKAILETIIQPTIKGMAKQDTPYVGFLYAGVMVDENDQPYVLEFNCRMGDPETQPLLMRLKSDLVELCLAGCKGQLGQLSTEWDPRVALAVVLASNGYPGKYEKGVPILGLDTVDTSSTKVFHAGTQIENNVTTTDGGRILAVTTLAKNVKTAQSQAYEALKKIKCEGTFYRHDIGHLAIS